MSKKLYSTNRWKRRVKARQEYQLRAARRQRLRRSTSRNAAHTPSARQLSQQKHHWLAAPATFSMVENPEEVVRFFHEMEFYAGGKFGDRRDVPRFPRKEN
jgi:hypothetical protein